MRTSSLLLTSSLLANGLLAGAVVWQVTKEAPRPSEASPAVAETAIAQSLPAGMPASSSSALDPAARELNAGVVSLVSLFNAGDAERLATALREAGLSEDIVRMLVREQIASRYRARIRAIEQEARGGDRPWWQGRSNVELSATQRAEIRQLQREMHAEMARALGNENTAGGTGRFAYLPAEKAELLARIDADYGELGRETREAMEGFPLPSDREALRLLHEERRKDVAALLTPEELRQFDMRNSPVAHRIQREFGTLIASEDEYRRIYDLAEAFANEYDAASKAGDLDRSDRAVAEAAVRQQVLDLLGPERATQYVQQRDPDYRTMQAATARLGLAPDATQRVMDLRAQVAQQSQVIAADAALEGSQRRAALNALANQAQAELARTLGPEGARSFAERSEWLRALERGSPFLVRPEGGVAVTGGGRGGNGSRPGVPVRGGRGGG